MNKLDVYHRQWGVRYLFLCPGCGCQHSIDVRTDGQKPSWQFNNDLFLPTFTPSIFYPERKCHFHIENGKIKYLPNCGHALAGQTIDMESIYDNSYFDY